MTQKAEPTAERWSTRQMGECIYVVDANNRTLMIGMGYARMTLAAAAPEMRDLLQYFVDYGYQREKAVAILAKIEGEG